MKQLTDLFTNPYLLTALSSWAVAQVLKTIIHAVLNKELDMTRLFGDGGMPSGHSATVTSLAIFTGLMNGFDSALFAATAVFAIVVCHDASGVRLETGKQAIWIKELVDMYEKMTGKDLPEVKLKEFVGHTPVQVAAGVTLGVVNAMIMYYCVFAV